MFFSDAIEALQVAHEVWAVMLGPLLLYAILFADDLVLLARAIKALQSLINAFAAFYESTHQQKSMDNIEALVFHGYNCTAESATCTAKEHCGGGRQCNLFVRRDILCEQISKHVFDEFDVV